MELSKDEEAMIKAFREVHEPPDNVIMYFEIVMKQWAEQNTTICPTIAKSDLTRLETVKRIFNRLREK